MSRRLRLLTAAALGMLILAGLAFAPASVARATGAVKWWTLETEHFFIHFRSGYGDTAREVALYAEKAYATLRAEFGQAPEKIDIVMDDRHDVTNGLTDPLFDRMTLYMPNLRWSDLGNARRESWLEALIFHELVHEINTNQVRGVPSLLRRVFGKIILPNAVKPMSFVEGLAVYEKYKHLGESRANDARTRMMVRQMVAEDRLPRLDQIEQFYKRDSWPPGSVPLLGGGIDRAARKAVGVPLTDLYDDFVDALNEEFGAEIESICAEGVTSADQLTSLGSYVESPAWVRSAVAGSGQRLGYAAQSSKRSGIRLFDPASGVDQEAFALASGARGSFPDWSPDGSSILYVAPELRSGPYLGLDIYTRNLACGAETRLTDGERAYYARYSPDGATIYYARIEERNCGTALCAIDIATGSRRMIRSFEDCNGSIHSFSVSPDGNCIAMALWRSGRQDIYLLSADGANLRQLTADTAQDSDPTWTPDGQHILFSSDPDRIYNIYAVSIGSGEIRKVTNLISGAFCPAVAA
ncbi:MAG: PD40 domain-containing protein [Firmicutes bacterium]|nr:PD40 domain-containing protein [Bacillota bacterium]